MLVVHHDSTRRPRAPLTPSFHRGEVYFPPHLVDETSVVAVAKAVQVFFHDVCLNQIETWEAIAKSQGNSRSFAISMLSLLISC